MKDQKKYRFLLAGGGTGGHLFPAVAVADQIKAALPEAEIMFIGTKSRIEGRVVPKMGYKFKSIWIKGFSRKFTLENILFPLKLLISVFQSIFINMKFKPQVAIGSGGYVSGPAVYGASIMGAKIILLEQNSYPGVTTRILERFADEIHISFEESQKYFKDKRKVKLTGNPVRESLRVTDKKAAIEKYGFNAERKTLLIIGGSLGAESINKAAAECVNELEKNNIQIIWQTGKLYFERYKDLSSNNIRINAFIDDMNSAYSACDLVLARAGATTIAEVTTLGIPAILVPSPNVAANHQYYNAKSLADKNAAVLINDKEIGNKFLSVVLDLINDGTKIKNIALNAGAAASKDAAKVIADSAIKYAKAV